MRCESLLVRGYFGVPWVDNYVGLSRPRWPTDLLLRILRPRFYYHINAKQFTPRSCAASVEEIRFFCPLVSPNLLLRSQNPDLVRHTHQMWNLKNARKSVCLQLDGKLLQALIHSSRSQGELRVWLTCGKSPWMFKKSPQWIVLLCFFLRGIFTARHNCEMFYLSGGVDITTMKQLSTLGALFSTANACSSNGCMITLVSSLCGEELCLWWLGECPRWLRCCAVDFLHNLGHERSVWEGDAGRCTGCSSSHPLHWTRGQPLISSSWVKALLCSSQTRRWHFTFVWSCFRKNDDENHPNHATDIDSLFCYVFRSHYRLYSL